MDVLRRKINTPTIRFQIWRFWTAAWPTSRRFHTDARLSCHFGCRGNEVDDFNHYLRCPSLWLIVEKCTSAPASSQSLLGRLGLDGSSSPAERLHALLQAAVATSTYLALHLEPELQRTVARAHVTRDVRPLGRAAAMVATDQAHTHGGKDFARVAPALRASA